MADVDPKSYVQGVCVVTASRIVNATDCLEPVVDVQAYEGQRNSTFVRQGAYMETVARDICHRLVNETSRFIDDHPIGSSANCYWWICNKNIGPAQYADSMPSRPINNQAAFVSMCTFVVLVGLCWITSLVLALLYCAERCCGDCYRSCSCGCCCMCLEDWANDIDSARAAKLYSKCTKCQVVFKRPDKQMMTLCPQCTAYADGIGNFLGGQGTQLESFVTDTVIDMCIAEP